MGFDTLQLFNGLLSALALRTTWPRGRRPTGGWKPNTGSSSNRRSTFVPGVWQPRISFSADAVQAQLDLFWMKDKSLTDTDALAGPDIIAAEIAEDLEAALEKFTKIAARLGGRANAQDDIFEEMEKMKARGWSDDEDGWPGHFFQGDPGSGVPLRGGYQFIARVSRKVADLTLPDDWLRTVTR
jgi:hypothetical protein